MTLSFDTLLHAPMIQGNAFYIIADHTFDFRLEEQERRRIGNKGTTSFVIDTLQMEVAVDSSQSLYIWGYSPMGKWKKAVLTPPNASYGALVARHTLSLIPGVAVGLEDMVLPNALFDPDAGWFCMGSKNLPTDSVAVEFATGCIAVLVNGAIFSLWVKPENSLEVAEYFLMQQKRHDEN